MWTRMQREDAALLVSPASMAALAESGYALLSAYQAHSERGHVWGKTDAESFRQWAANFDRECVRRNWMPRAGLESRIGASLNSKTLPQEVLLVGFDRTTPAQDSLLGALAACGVQVQVAEDGFHPQPEFIRTAGLREEIAACAWWARMQVEKNPEARVGILVPDMGAMRCEIERIFRRVLMPKTDDVFAAQAMPFEFSLGHPLAHVPAIRAALLLLRWLHAPLLEEEVSWLLLSGFLASSSVDYLALAKLDATLRNGASLSLEIALPAFLKRPETRRLHSLAKLESAQRSAVANRVGEDDRLPGRWVDLAQSLLRDAGWPGADRDTLHFQALRRWEHALDEIAMLDFDGQRVGYGDFLQTLEAHALETVFSPESQGAPVQIMGALESSGQQFDALWFLSVDDGSWPQRGRPHPLLPNDVQLRFRMPYADAESDLELVKAFTVRIAASAPSVVFSHAERNQDGELRPSPLLPQDVDWKTVRSLPTPIDHMAEGLEEIEDASESIAWPVDRSAGGSEVLKNQAACPFRAFATKRLHAKELNRSDWGLSAAERGKLVHKALEKIWSPSEGALHSLDDLQSAIREGRLAGILTSAITKAFAKVDVMDDPWIRAYLSGEQRRLQLRLEEWMRIEAERMPFEVIGCEEQLSGVGVGNLKLNLRTDRIDQVDGFKRLLIDYKTGAVSPSDWKPPRPGDPQLPLYAVFGEVEDLRGVLFARIRAGENCFSGCVADEAPQPFADVKRNASFIKDPYTETMRDEWEVALLALAEEFLRGEAAVNPKDGKKTCEFCPLPGLCRVAEARNPLEEKPDAEENDSDD